MTDDDVTTPEPDASPEVDEAEAPEDAEETPEAEQPDPEPDEAQTDDATSEDEGDTEDEPEPVEVEEFEFEGEKYTVPAALKGALMMHRDYTQKTQEVAEQRKALETEKEQFTQQSKLQTEHLQDVARLTSIDEQLEQYRTIDWDRARAEQPEEANAAFQQFTLLRDQRDGVVSSLQQKHAEVTQQAQQETAKRLETARDYAQREIQNWSPELESKLSDFAKGHGIEPELVRQAAVTNPATLKIIHLAYLGEQFLEKQRAAAKPKPKEVKPVAKVKGSGAPQGGPRDDQSSEDWLKARNRQLAKRTA